MGITLCDVETDIIHLIPLKPFVHPWTFLWQWLLHLFVCITQRLQILQDIWLIFIQTCVVVGTSAQIMVTLYCNLNQTDLLML